MDEIDNFKVNNTYGVSKPNHKGRSKASGPNKKYSFRKMKIGEVIEIKGNYHKTFTASIMFCKRNPDFNIKVIKGKAVNEEENEITIKRCENNDK